MTFEVKPRPHHPLQTPLFWLIAAAAAVTLPASLLHHGLMRRLRRLAS